MNSHVLLTLIIKLKSGVTYTQGAATVWILKMMSMMSCLKVLLEITAHLVQPGITSLISQKIKQLPRQP
jgi:hypothetical protein